MGTYPFDDPASTAATFQVRGAAGWWRQADSANEVRRIHPHHSPLPQSDRKLGSICRSVCRGMAGFVDDAILTMSTVHAVKWQLLAFAKGPS